MLHIEMVQCLYQISYGFINIMEATTVNANETQTPKVLNKLGTASYGLVAIGSFLPAITIKMWGVSESITGLDVYGFTIVLLMIVGSASCALGLPKIVAKGIGAVSLAYLYYHLFQAIGDLNEMAQMMGGRRGGELGQIIELALQSANIGIVALLLGFISLNIFMFVGYKLHPRFEALDVILKHYSSKASEKAVEKSTQIKKATEEKASAVKQKANQVQKEQIDKGE
ncbi:hypothetical protein AB4559_04490 [Vibrio sp. 10N.222.51.C8]|uniref:hypothetical protein n=1 Tax=unclassified Vibrio TaxID=2614977 RepID=UPI00105692DA|nr:MULTISPECIES: hypothetical protein [unclassified Vibrio]TKF51397.1 hypothetical protein FCV60_17635 [Vibrio sp. F13]TKF75231.1 hypothetical protein FCV59_07335 [Vibrio sp. F13]TKG32740.1 hypothetical protein FCV85_10105 [Vibrio sp. F13]